MWQILIPAITSIIDKIIPDANQAQEAKAKILEMQLKGELDNVAGQIAINVEEARSGSVFVSGWRPAVGWVCATGLAYAAVLEPVLRFAAQVGYQYSGAFPVIDTDLTMQILAGILGLGAFRSYEKKQGVAAK